MQEERQGAREMSRWIKEPTFAYRPGQSRPWKLLAPAIYRSDEVGEVTVPSGYETDLASVPRIPGVYWRVGNKAVLPAIVHDWLYECSRGITRKQADKVFLEAMRDCDEGLWPTTRWAMYMGVRIGGGFPWRRYRRAQA